MEREHLERKRLEEAERSLRRTWYGTRRGRRILVFAGVASIATFWVSAGVCWYLAPSDTAMWTTFALLGFGLLLYFSVLSVFVVASQGMIGPGAKDLDERQLAELRHVYTLAHRGTTWMLVVLVLIASRAPAGWPGEEILKIPGAAAFLTVGAALATHVIMPHLIVGWRLSDPPPEDEDEWSDEDLGSAGDGQPIEGNTAT
jgi:hypothetical protein